MWSVTDLCSCSRTGEWRGGHLYPYGWKVYGGSKVWKKRFVEFFWYVHFSRKVFSTSDFGTLSSDLQFLYPLPSPSLSTANSFISQTTYSASALSMNFTYFNWNIEMFVKWKRSSLFSKFLKYPLIFYHWKKFGVSDHHRDYIYCPAISRYWITHSRVATDNRIINGSHCKRERQRNFRWIPTERYSL